MGFWFGELRWIPLVWRRNNAAAKQQPPGATRSSLKDLSRHCRFTAHVGHWVFKGWATKIRTVADEQSQIMHPHLPKGTPTGPTVVGHFGADIVQGTSGIVSLRWHQAADLLDAKPQDAIRKELAFGQAAVSEFPLVELLATGDDAVGGVLFRNQPFSQLNPHPRRLDFDNNGEPRFVGQGNVTFVRQLLREEADRIDPTGAQLGADAGPLVELIVIELATAGLATAAGASSRCAVPRGLKAPRGLSGSAHNAANAAKLTEHLGQLEKYGAAGFKGLPNGRIRYYGNLIPADKAGPMAGRRLVREWDPATGATRTWMETLDHAGRVRIVRPETGGPKIHYLFDEFGNSIGTF